MSKDSNSKNEHYFDSTNLYVFLFRYKLHLAIILIASTLISVIVSFNIQEKYKSIAVVYPSNTSSVAKALISTRLGGKTDIMEFGEEEKSEQLLEILNSDRVKSALIKKFNLLEHYKIDTAAGSTPMYDLHSTMKDNIRFAQNKNMAVEIIVYDHSPDTASLIASEILNILDSTYNEIQRERTVQAYQLVKESYETMQKEIKIHEDSLKLIMQKGVLSLEAQAEVYGDAYAQAVSKGNTKAIAALEKKLEVLQNHGADFMRLNHLIQIEREKLMTMKSKYEEAKLDAESSIQNFFKVTRPFPAERKSYPIRWLIVSVSVIASLLTGIITIFFYEQSQRVKAAL